MPNTILDTVRQPLATAFEVYDVSMGYAEIQTTAKAGSKRHGLSPEVSLRLERATQPEFTDSG